MRVLIIGANGMIGNTMFKVLSGTKDWDVFGSIRDENGRRYFAKSVSEGLVSGIDMTNHDSIVQVLYELQPNIVINCAGLTKHKEKVNDPVSSILINGLMPHRLSALCKIIGARLVHISTDCVFSGMKGNYTEKDFPDAIDIYGKTKALGEVDSQSDITLRTSTIGHELQSNHGLLNWFLSQESSCKGFARAIFSGLPTVVFAQVIRDIIIPKPELSGLYHVAAKPINKFELLSLIANVYGKTINIIRDEKLVIDRSLNAERFEYATGYVAPEWPNLIELMHKIK
jgi:dTDP-4-dehydrorhamnose reductase